MNKYERVPAWHLNVGGKLEPVEGPTATETPAAKHDVEALLREADATSGAYSTSNRTLIHDLAAALRAERERADAMTEKSCKDWESRRIARSHLRAVLDFMWPGDGGPTVVQKARAFLAGEGPVVQPENDATWLRRMWNEEVERHAKTQADDLAKLHEIGRLKSERSLLRANLSKAEAKLSAEDEAHAHTRARLVEVERYVDENVQARQNAQFRAADLEIRLAEALKGQTRASDELGKALAAQNWAESEAAGLRAQLADLETAIRAIVDRVEKGRA